MANQKQIDISSFINKEQLMKSLIVENLSQAKSALSDRALEEPVRFRENGCSLIYSNVKSIYGQIKKRCVGIGDRSIITLFDKTPYPKNPSDVVCPHFIELKWANGCRFNCSWCYLNGTFRFQARGKAPYLKDPKKIIKHITTFLENVREPEFLNSGELSDSLVYEGNSFSLTKDIIPLFKEQDTHKLLILTKSANVRNILKSEAQKQVVVSFTVNSNKVAKRWEKKAPTPGQRIRAAKKLVEAGYEVRLRIDPMVPISGWKKEYKELLSYIFKSFTPSRITLGTLRGLQSTLIHSKDTSWAEYLDDRSNWGKKINFKKRFDIYSYIIDTLNNKFEYYDIGICKETKEMLKELNIDYRKMKCNCIR